jgi:predicted dehydrogenase
MRFPGEVLAQFVSSFRTPPQSYMEVTGSKSSLYVGDPFKPGLEETLLLRSGQEVEALEIAGRDLYLGEIEDLADAVLRGKPPRVSLADSRGNIAALVALLESAKKNTVIRVKV